MPRQQHLDPDATDVDVVAVAVRGKGAQGWFSLGQSCARIHPR